jgi:hypothetical protein
MAPVLPRWGWAPVKGVLPVGGWTAGAGRGGRGGTASAPRISHKICSQHCNQSEQECARLVTQLLLAIQLRPACWGQTAKLVFCMTPDITGSMAVFARHLHLEDGAVLK